MTRLERILDETDRRQIGEQLREYIKTGSEKYVYGLRCPALDYKSSFSRAVELSFPTHRQLLISGTASIDPDGASAHLNDTMAQIELTIQVVKAVLSSRGMDWADLSRGIAYFKNRADIVLWEEWVLKNNLPRFPLGVSHADVCREYLLFEIEVDAVQLA